MPKEAPRAQGFSGSGDPLPTLGALIVRMGVLGSFNVYFYIVRMGVLGSFNVYL